VWAGPPRGIWLEPRQLLIARYKPKWGIGDSLRRGRSENAAIFAGGKAKIVEYWSEGGYYPIPQQSETFLPNDRETINDYLWVWSKGAHFTFFVENRSSARHFYSITIK
jgi:hypothetical protein